MHILTTAAPTRTRMQFRDVHDEDTAAPKGVPFGNPFADDKAVRSYKGLKVAPASPAQAKRLRTGMTISFTVFACIYAVRHLRWVCDGGRKTMTFVLTLASRLNTAGKSLLADQKILQPLLRHPHQVQRRPQTRPVRLRRQPRLQNRQVTLALWAGHALLQPISPCAVRLHTSENRLVDGRTTNIIAPGGRHLSATHALGSKQVLLIATPQPAHSLAPRLSCEAFSALFVCFQT